MRARIVYDTFNGKQAEQEPWTLNFEHTESDDTQSIENIIEDIDGRLFATCPGPRGMIYTTQLNFCPFTGTPAETKRTDYVEPKSKV